jgi:hypothetical protein
MENKKQFLNVLNGAAVIYDKDLSKDLLSSYWAIFQEYDFYEFNNAMNEICRTLKFWPKPAEIIGVILKNKGAASIEARAEQQWRVVVGAVRNGGAGREPGFMDSITSWIIKNQIKWGYLCEMLQADEKWEQKRFCRAYELIAQNPDLLQIEGGAGAAVKELTKGMLKQIGKGE